MLDTFNQIVLAGGITHCIPNWSKTSRSVLDNCLKLYIPLDGEGQIRLSGKTIPIKPPNLYLFNASVLQEQFCDTFLDVCWIHFTPSSLKLKHILYKYFTVYVCPRDSLSFIKELLSGMGKLLSDRKDILKMQSETSIIQTSLPLKDDSIYCQVQAALIFLIGEILRHQPMLGNLKEQAMLDKLSPAIDFMDKNYHSNPSLAIIAKKVFMAPNYFHRLFVDNFGISPYRYMLKKRLSESRQLLSMTNLNIKEIAAICGYENEFYFSRIFKKNYNLSPREYRNIEWTL